MEDAMQAIRVQDGWELLGSVPGWCPGMLVFVTAFSDARADWLSEVGARAFPSREADHREISTYFKGHYFIFF